LAAKKLTPLQGQHSTPIGSMMGNTTDPSMKAQMQKMHDQMGAMMSNMQKMGGGGMMQGGQTK
jgi:hypothetical protein